MPVRSINLALVNNLVADINKATAEMHRLEGLIASGKKFIKPSDDPRLATRSLRLRTKLRELDLFEQNVQDARTWLNFTDPVLVQTKDALVNAKTYALAGANSFDPLELASLAQTVNGLILSTLEAANSDISGKFIFAGGKTNTSPFTENDPNSPSQITYNGDMHQMATEIGLGRSFKYSLNGFQVFQPKVARRIIGNFKVSNITAPLDEVLPGPAIGGATSINISIVGGGVIGIGFNTTVDTLTTVRDGINAQFALNLSPARAVINSNNQLEIISGLEEPVGQITISDVPANGIFTRLGLINAAGTIVGTEFKPPAQDGVFETLMELRDALNGRAFAEDNMTQLTDLTNSLGLQTGDVVNVTWDVGGGPVITPITVSSGTTLANFASSVQVALRAAAGSDTAFVTVQNGKLKVINSPGPGSANYTAITISTGGVRPTFDAVMAPITGAMNANGSTKFSNDMGSGTVANNISNRFSDIDREMRRVLQLDTDAGSQLARIETNLNKIADTRTATELLLGETEGLDLAKASIDLQNQTLIYQAALAVAGKAMLPSLFNFIT